MIRKVSEVEKSLLRRLVGDDAPFRQDMEAQLKECVVNDLGCILEFHPATSTTIDVDRTLIGEGSSYDTDGIPIIVSLLQKNGYLWKLDISRADSGPMRGHLDYDRVLSLGFGEGLSLERTRDIFQRSDKLD